MLFGCVSKIESLRTVIKVGKLTKTGASAGRWHTDQSSVKRKSGVPKDQR